MNITDLLTIAAIVGAVNVVLGNWAKSRIEHSIKHEYDQALEKIKSEWKRADILLAERMAAFKLLQKSLVSIRRYCQAQIGSGKGSEFSTRPDDLGVPDNKSILMHWTELEILLDENLVFLSNSCLDSFEELRNQLSIGACMELYLASAQPVLEIVTSKTDCYQSISGEIDKCIHALFKDLGFEH
jgi:hypothetical protein